MVFNIVDIQKFVFNAPWNRIRLRISQAVSVNYIALNWRQVNHDLKSLLREFPDSYKWKIRDFPAVAIKVKPQMSCSTLLIICEPKKYEKTCSRHWAQWKNVLSLLETVWNVASAWEDLRKCANENILLSRRADNNVLKKAEAFGLKCFTKSNFSEWILVHVWPGAYLKLLRLHKLELLCVDKRSHWRPARQRQ